MTRRKYLLRLIIPFAIMIVAVVALSGWLIYSSAVATARQQQVSELRSDASLLAQVVRRAGSVDETVVRRMSEDAKYRGVRFTIVEPTGRVSLDTHVELEKLDNHNQRPEVIDARRDGEGHSIRPSTSMGVDYIYVATRVDNPDGLVVRASRPERSPIAFSAAMLVRLAFAAGLAILIMSWLAHTLNRRWIRPVRSLALAAEQLASGNWQTRVEPAGDGEIREFSGQLNDLAERAQKQLRDLQQQRTELTALVESMPDAVILTDPQHRVVLMNEPAAIFMRLDVRQAMGAKLISILGEPGLVEIYEYIGGPQARAGTPYTREIRALRNGQKLTYQSVAVRTPTGGVLLVLRDVTRQASAVQMKTDFVANASHELRTPIAAIKIAFETLRDVYVEDPQQSERCITIIEGHLKRLEDLLQDLLDLSRVESSEIKPEIRKMRAGEVLNVVRNTMGPLARNKEVELSVDGDDQLEFQSDRRLLDLVLKNLVENAVKYTPTGGNVRVRMYREAPSQPDMPADIVLSVVDTGIGIPPQHLERVFERFYQVDATRSGSSGRGTGLGLAIVKHAVLALAGQVKLDSTVGRGTTVTCRFPEGNLVPITDSPDVMTAVN